MSIRTQSGLKLMPWESWQQWNHVRESVFSSSPARISAALNKIAAWRARGSLPVAVEVTGDLISIQMRDPFFLGKACSPATAITDEMLRLMYAMAIMRLVNGVVDQSKKQNSASVALRAEVAGLPRMLVDTRHEVAHKELPSIAFLQLASKQALEWLEVQYWGPQKKVLDDAHKHLKDKLCAHASLVEELQKRESTPMPDAKIEKDSEKELVKFVSSAVPDVVAILVEEDLLEKCVTEKGIWRYVVSKLCSRVPILLKEVVAWCIKRLRNSKCENISGLEFLNLLIGQAHEKRTAQHAVTLALAKLSSPTTTLLGECNNTDEADGIVSGAARHEQLVGSNSEDGVLELEFQRNESALSEARKRLQAIYKKNGTVLSNDELNHEVLSETPELRKAQPEKAFKKTDTDVVDLSLKGAWSIAENWRPCAIGMLPSTLHSSGVLPPFQSTVSDLARQDDLCEVDLINEVQDEVPVQENAATLVNMGVKMLEIGPERVRLKRNSVENQIKETPAKKMKGEASNKVESQKPKVNLVQDDTPGGGQRSKSQLQGFLLLDGLYQICGSEQFAAIQSAIEVFR